MLPFTHEQFVDVFAAYNVAVWPMQIVAYLLAAFMLALLLRRKPSAHRLIGAGLGIMWLWTGIGYHWLFFTGINNAAWLFGALFIAQGLLLIFITVVQGRVIFASSNSPSAYLGWGFVAYATVIYPFLGLMTGHGYPGMPMFGITPCPVTIFTFGMLLLTGSSVPRWLLLIPLVWSLIGGSAAFLLRVPQDWFLLFSGLAILPIILRDRRRHLPQAA